MKEIFQTFKRLKWFFKNNIKNYLLCGLALLFVSIMPVIPTKVLGIAIDDIIMGNVSLFRIIFYIIGLWKLFKKAGKNGWKAIIPFYNTYVLVEIAGLNWWYFLIAIFGTIVSFVGISGLDIIASLASYAVNFFIFYNLAKRMKKSEVGYGVLAIFFEPIMVMILGFSKAQYDSSIEVSPNGPIESK